MAQRMQTSFIVVQQQQGVSNGKTLQTLKSKGAMASLVASQDKQVTASKVVGMFVLGFLSGKVANDDGFQIVPKVQVNLMGK